MKEKRAFLINIVVLLTTSVICSFLMIFVCRWNVTIQEYDDVDYEWDDDRDRYDIWVDGIGHLYMPTDKATLVFLPTDATQNYAVVKKEETIFGKLEKYSLMKFYINCGYKGE